MIRQSVLACPLAMALGACTVPDSVVERGTPPAVEASVLRQDAWLQLHPNRVAGELRLPDAERHSLERAVRLVTLGRPEAVRATVTARALEADPVRRALIGYGLDPARIVIAGDSRVPPLTAQVSMSRFVLHTRDCGDAIQPSTNPGIDVASSLGSLGRCVQANNLAQMLADPGDLLASPPLAPQPGVVAGGAIERARNQLGVSAVLPGVAGGTPAAGPVAPNAAGAADAGAAPGPPP